MGRNVLFPQRGVWEIPGEEYQLDEILPMMPISSVGAVFSIGEAIFFVQYEKSRNSEIRQSETLFNFAFTHLFARMPGKCNPTRCDIAPFANDPLIDEVTHFRLMIPSS